MLLNFVINTTLDILKPRHGDAIKKRKYALLDAYTEGKNDIIFTNHNIHSKSRLIVECRHVSHNYSLEIALRMYNNESAN